jgi:translation initiation factor IF-3
LAKNFRNPNLEKKDEAQNFRLNDAIRVPEIRLVGDNFDEISEIVGKEVETGVFKTRWVLEIAQKMNLDVVEISPNANPPVCRIIDLKKFLYERKRKEKELKAKQVKVVIKEIRFGPNTDDHDFEFKVKHAITFLEEGAKVKAYVQFKGRSIVFNDRGKELLDRFLTALNEVGAPEYQPKLEERRMHVTIAPKKAAPVKKKKDENGKES